MTAHLIKNLSLVFHYEGQRPDPPFAEKIFRGNSDGGKTTRGHAIPQIFARLFSFESVEKAEKGMRRKGASGAYGTKKIWIKPTMNRALPYPISALFSAPPLRVSFLRIGKKCGFHWWELVKNPGRSEYAPSLSTSRHLRTEWSIRSHSFFPLPLVFAFHRKSASIICE